MTSSEKVAGHHSGENPKETASPSPEPDVKKGGKRKKQGAKSSRPSKKAKTKIVAAPARKRRDKKRATPPIPALEGGGGESPEPRNDGKSESTKNTESPMSRTENFQPVPSPLSQAAPPARELSFTGSDSSQTKPRSHKLHTRQRSKEVAEASPKRRKRDFSADSRSPSPRHPSPSPRRERGKRDHGSRRKVSAKVYFRIIISGAITSKRAEDPLKTSRFFLLIQ
ncbi:MAG: hypothetical protein GY799_23275 [Desulfobulbaceae bacterium]|nr:hypothetical protein [Desulfobulbaceae bacterium]